MVLDIHSREKYLNYIRDNINNLVSIKENRKLILDYLDDAALGKTTKKGAYKKVGNHRLVRSAGILIDMSERFFKKPLNKVTQKEFEKFIKDWDNDAFKTKDRRIGNNLKKIGDKREAVLVKGGQNYASETKANYKQFMCKYFNYTNSKIDTSFVETTSIKTKLEALTKEDIYKLRDNCSDPIIRLSLQVCFDLGDRIAEFLNYKITDIKEEATSDGRDSYYLFEIKIPNNGRKKHERTNPTLLPETSKLVKEYLEQVKLKNIEAIKQNKPIQEYFVDYNYETMKAKLKRLAVKVFGREKASKIRWHVIRHSAATYWCTRLDRASFAKRFGWSYTSHTPDQYIDDKKLEQKETAEKHIKTGYNFIKEENEELKIRLNSLQEKVSVLERRDNVDYVETVKFVLKDLIKGGKLKAEEVEGEYFVREVKD